MEINRTPLVSAIMTAAQQDTNAAGPATMAKGPGGLQVVPPFMDALVAASAANGSSFAQQLAGTDAAPPLPTDPSVVSPLVDRLSGVAFFDVAALMKMLIDNTSEQRKANSAQKLALLDASISKSEQAVEELKSAAVSRLIGGILGGMAQVAGGAMTAVGGVKALKVDDAAASQAIGNKFAGAGTAMQGFGQISAAGANMAADTQQATSQGYEIEARQIDKFFEETKDLGDNLKELVQATLTALRELDAALLQASGRIVNA